MLLNETKIKMVEDFIRNEDVKITASQISKDKKLNQKSVYLFLEELEERNLLKSNFQGKNKLYSLKKENKEEVKHFLLLLEHFRTLLFYGRHPNLKVIFEKISPHVRGMIIVFGSYAKGTEKKTSDLDLFICGKYNKEKIEEIVDVFNIEINIHFYKNFKESPLTKEIKKDHTLIKNFESYLEEAYSWTS